MMGWMAKVISPLASQSTMLQRTSDMTDSKVYEGCHPLGEPVFTRASMQMEPPAVT